MNSLRPSPAPRIPPRRGFRGNAWVGARSDAEDRSRALTRARGTHGTRTNEARASNFFPLSLSLSLSLSRSLVLSLSLFLSLRATGYVLGRRDPLVTSRASARSFATTKLYELNGRYTLAPRNLQFTLPRRAVPCRAEPRVARSLARLREKDAESLSIKAPRLAYAPRRGARFFFFFQVGFRQSRRHQWDAGVRNLAGVLSRPQEKERERKGKKDV